VGGWGREAERRLGTKGEWVEWSVSGEWLVWKNMVEDEKILTEKGLYLGRWEREKESRYK